MIYKHPTKKREEELLRQVNKIIEGLMVGYIRSGTIKVELPNFLEAVAKAGIAKNESEFLLVGAMVFSAFAGLEEVGTLLYNDKKRSIH